MTGETRRPGRDLETVRRELEEGRDTDDDPPVVGVIGVLSTLRNGGDVAVLDRDRRLALVAGERRRLTEEALARLTPEEDEGLREGPGR